MSASTPEPGRILTTAQKAAIYLVIYEELKAAYARGWRPPGT
jgi:hypothetical protein